MVWVDNGAVWGIPDLRLAGIYARGNGEFSTQLFALPSHPLWLNAAASWQGGNHVGGADEGRQAYIMAELQALSH